MPADRRTLWLAATLVAAIVALVVVRSGTDPAAPAATPRAGAARTTAPQAETMTAPSDLNLEALTAPRGDLIDQDRNPFRFQPRVEAPTPVRRLPGVADDQVGAPPPRGPSGAPPPPPITLKFIGVVTTADGTKIAVLSDGTRPIHGREGEEIEGRYKILKIGNESLEIAYLDGRGRQTIRMTGQ